MSKGPSNAQTSDDAQNDRLMRSLTNQTPNASQVRRIELLRLNMKEAGEALIILCPSSRERSLAITKLEECVMWAVKSIVMEETEQDDE